MKLELDNNFWGRIGASSSALENSRQFAVEPSQDPKKQKNQQPPEQPPSEMAFSQ
jgi:hypothetical protein